DPLPGPDSGAARAAWPWARLFPPRVERTVPGDCGRCATLFRLLQPDPGGRGAAADPRATCSLPAATQAPDGIVGRTPVVGFHRGRQYREGRIPERGVPDVGGGFGEPNRRGRFPRTIHPLPCVRPCPGRENRGGDRPGWAVFAPGPGDVAAPGGARGP